LLLLVLADASRVVAARTRQVVESSRLLLLFLLLLVLADTSRVVAARVRQFVESRRLVLLLLLLLVLYNTSCCCCTSLKRLIVDAFLESGSCSLAKRLIVTWCV
jgi:hypothetical protein